MQWASVFLALCSVPPETSLDLMDGFLIALLAKSAFLPGLSDPLYILFFFHYSLGMFTQGMSLCWQKVKNIKTSVVHSVGDTTLRILACVLLPYLAEFIGNLVFMVSTLGLSTTSLCSLASTVCLPPVTQTRLYHYCLHLSPPVLLPAALLMQPWFLNLASTFTNPTYFSPLLCWQYVILCH